MLIQGSPFREIGDTVLIIWGHFVIRFEVLLDQKYRTNLLNHKSLAFQGTTFEVKVEI